jgi:hypothetical protein
MQICCSFTRIDDFRCHCLHFYYLWCSIIVRWVVIRNKNHAPNSSSLPHSATCFSHSCTSLGFLHIIRTTSSWKTVFDLPVPQTPSHAHPVFTPSQQHLRPLPHL